MKNSESEENKNQILGLLSQIAEMLKEPPIIIDFYDWREDLEQMMREIHSLSPHIHDRLDDLVSEAIRLGALHVNDIDKEEISPNEVEQSSINYYEQIAFINSEINSIKSL